VHKEIYGLDFMGALKSVMNFRYDDERVLLQNLLIGKRN